MKRKDGKGKKNIKQKKKRKTIKIKETKGKEKN